MWKSDNHLEEDLSSKLDFTHECEHGLTLLRGTHLKSLAPLFLKTWIGYSLF